MNRSMTAIHWITYVLSKKERDEGKEGISEEITRFPLLYGPPSFGHDGSHESKSQKMKYFEKRSASVVLR